MDKLSDAEMYTWNFLEENRAKVQHYSIIQLADLAHVSSATIVRTLKKRGFDGFSDYKNALKRDNLDVKQENLRVKGLSDEANTFVYKSVEEVTRTVNLLNADDLSSIVKLIKSSKIIVTIARGVNAGVCDDLTHRLQTIGKNAISRYYDNMVSYAERLTSEDLIIVVSSTGDEGIIVSAVKAARKHGTKAIVLTCDYQSSLAQVADYLLLAYRTKLDKEELAGDAESTIPMELLSRIMVDMYLIFEEKGTIRG